VEHDAREPPARQDELDAQGGLRRAREHDPSIPQDIRRELAKLRNPSAVSPTVKETHEPAVDEGFRKLGIVR